MSWKQTSNSGYFGMSSNGKNLFNATAGYFGQGTSDPNPATAKMGYYGQGGPNDHGYAGQGGADQTDPGYFGLGDR